MRHGSCILYCSTNYTEISYLEKALNAVLVQSLYSVIVQVRIVLNMTFIVGRGSRFDKLRKKTVLESSGCTYCRSRVL